MESSAAGYVDAGSALSQDLRRLGELRPPVPVLSLYLDLDPRQFSTIPARSSAVTSLVDDARRRVEAIDPGHDAKLSLRADVDRAAAFLEDLDPQGAHGVAIFSASAAELFETFLLARSTPPRAVIADSPYLTPLVSAADPRDWLVVLVDTSHARLLHGNAARLEEIERIEDTVLGQHESQGTTNHQRWVEQEVDGHLRKIADGLDERLRRGGFQRVLIGGPPEIAPRFEQALSNSVRDKLAGRFEAEVTYATPDAVRDAAAGCFEADERRHERAVLDRLAERLGRGERAVAGIADVLVMLEQARVETLLYTDDFEAPDPAVLDTAIEDALGQSAEVLPVRHHRDELAPHGHVAAVLRF